MSLLLTALKFASDTLSEAVARAPRPEGPFIPIPIEDARDRIPRRGWVTDDEFEHLLERRNYE